MENAANLNSTLTAGNEAPDVSPIGAVINISVGAAHRSILYLLSVTGCCGSKLGASGITYTRLGWPLSRTKYRAVWPLTGGRIVSGILVPGELVPEGLVPGGFVPGGLVSGGLVSGGLVSGGLISGGLVPGGFVAGGVPPLGRLEGPSSGAGCECMTAGACLATHDSTCWSMKRCRSKK